MSLSLDILFAHFGRFCVSHVERHGAIVYSRYIGL